MFAAKFDYFIFSVPLICLTKFNYISTRFQEFVTKFTGIFYCTQEFAAKFDDLSLRYPRVLLQGVQLPRCDAI